MTRPAILVPLFPFALAACVSTGSHVGNGAVGGAAIGAVGGQLVGGDTEATLLGAGLGAAVGAAAAAETAPRRRICQDAAGNRFEC